LKISQGFEVVNLPVKYFFIIAIFVFILSSNVYGHENTSAHIGIDDKTGKYIPLDLTFSDEKGNEVTSRDVFNKPTVLTLVYYSCDHMCPQMLEGLAEVIPKIGLTPGRDFEVITLSFDSNDTPRKACEVKANYIKAIGKPFPEDSWKFLTGSRENIKRFTDAVGFKFQETMHGIVHPVVLIILSPQGKITRYIYVSKYLGGVAYPVTFLPVDLTDAIRNASNGVVAAAGTRRAPLLCFPHEPEQQEKFFSILSISGSAMLILMAALFIYLLVKNKKQSEQKHDRHGNQ